MVKGDVVIPAGMMPIQFNRPLRQSHAALPIAGERDHDRHIRQGSAIPRIERHGPLRSLAKGGEVAIKEVHRRKFFPTHLASRINLNRPPGGISGAIQRFLPWIEPIEILQLVQVRKTGPGVGVVGLAFERPFQAGAEHGMLLRIDLLHEGVVAQDKFGRAKLLHLSISRGGGHGANQNSIPVRDGGHDVVGEVVLNLECARVAALAIAALAINDFAVIRLRPKLRAAHGVHQLRADAKGAASFAYAALDHIACVQFTAHHADIRCLGFVGHRGIVGDNLKIRKSR
ncbi:MAG TPA: hypothetical protein VKG79_16765, partial [Bryobacteraceae bacterium]|nr:hypothetical protein [Bryobacteraceae bacterium]